MKEKNIPPRPAPRKLGRSKGSYNYQATPTNQGQYYIRNIATGKYLDVEGGRCQNGGNIHLWSYHGGANQRWYDGPNNSIMSACCQNMVLDIEQMSCNAGSNLQIWTYHGQYNQQFIFEYGHLYNPVCNVAVDNSPYGGYDGNNVITWTKTGSQAQCWEIIYA